MPFSKLLINNFPIGTLLINVTGCFLIGLFINNNQFQKFPFNEFVIIGILGGFTTFSAFGIETYNLIKNESRLIGMLYISSSIIFGLIAIYISSKFNSSF